MLKLFLGLRRYAELLVVTLAMFGQYQAIMTSIGM